MDYSVRISKYITGTGIKAEITSGKGIDRGREWGVLKKTLGYLACPGTLNIKLEERWPDKDESAAVRVFNFRMLPAKWGNHPCHIGNGGKYLRNKKMFFVIAPIKLRDHYDLKDGDKVEVVIDD